MLIDLAKEFSFYKPPMTAEFFGETTIYQEKSIGKRVVKILGSVS